MTTTITFDEITRARRTIFDRGRIKLAGNRMVGMTDNRADQRDASAYNALAEAHRKLVDHMAHRRKALLT